MKDLGHAYRNHLNAAEGWLGLGDLNEAKKELDKISVEVWLHPAVLFLRCQIYVAAKEWDFLISVSEMLVKELPQLSDVWVFRSHALHELKRTQAAYDLLLPAADKFPNLAVIPYNLACYACQLGKLAEAKKRLEQAIDLGGDNSDIRADALGNPDLQPLWKDISSL